MNLKLIHNLPYVLLLVLMGTIFNWSLDGRIIWSKFFSLIPLVYCCLWFCQKISVTAGKFTLLNAFKKEGYLMVLLAAGGIYGHYWKYRTVSVIDCGLYSILSVLTLVIIEKSLYADDRHFVS